MLPAFAYAERRSAKEGQLVGEGRLKGMVSVVDNDYAFKNLVSQKRSLQQ